MNFPDSSHDVIMKKIDSPDNVSLIKKQLEAQTREHNLLKNQIPDHEQFLKVSTKQCSFFILRQESGCSGYQIIATHSLKKLFLSVFFFSFCGLVFCCASLIVCGWRAKTLDSFFLQNGAIWISLTLMILCCQLCKFENQRKERHNFNNSIKMQFLSLLEVCCAYIYSCIYFDLRWWTDSKILFSHWGRRWGTDCHRSNNGWNI